jgi:hypothetical protein
VQFSGTEYIHIVVEHPPTTQNFSHLSKLKLPITPSFPSALATTILLPVSEFGRPEYLIVEDSHYLSFCDQLISTGLMSSRLCHWKQVSEFPSFKTDWCSIVCAYILFICSCGWTCRLIPPFGYWYLIYSLTQGPSWRKFWLHLKWMYVMLSRVCVWLLIRSVFFFLFYWVVQALCFHIYLVWLSYPLFFNIFISIC